MRQVGAGKVGAFGPVQEFPVQRLAFQGEGEGALGDSQRGAGARVPALRLGSGGAGHGVTQSAKARSREGVQESGYQQERFHSGYQRQVFQQTSDDGSQHVGG